MKFSAEVLNELKEHVSVEVETPTSSDTCIIRVGPEANIDCGIAFIITRKEAKALSNCIIEALK
jgi:hypothetical protein